MTPLPHIVTAQAYMQCPAHPLHLIYGAVSVNELIFHRGCFEKMANAFFNMSRSSVTSTNDFLIFRSSSASGFMCPLPGNASSLSSRYSRFQRCITLGWISKSRSNAQIFRAPAVTNRITSSLNSLPKLLRSLLFSTAHLLVFLFLSLTFGVSIISGEFHLP